LNEITNLRRLRLKHRITLDELALTAHVPNQEVSRVELLQRPATQNLESKYEAALEEVIVQRYDAVKALEHDYRSIKGNLLHGMEE